MENTEGGVFSRVEVYWKFPIKQLGFIDSMKIQSKTQILKFILDGSYIQYSRNVTVSLVIYPVYGKPRPSSAEDTGQTWKCQIFDLTLPGGQHFFMSNSSYKLYSSYSVTLQGYT